MNSFKIFILSILFSILSISVVNAADFNVLPATGAYAIKGKIVTNIKIDSSSDTINAAQLFIKFDPNVLEVVSVSKENSIFSFWLQEPTFSNTDGKIECIGGTVNGVSGSSLEVLQITFNTKSIGSSEVSLVDSSITAADDTGTNVLANANGAKYVVSTSSVIPIATPVPISRPAVVASGLPVLPVIEVPLYPNQNNWYNTSSAFSVSWKLPSDISGISTVFNTDPTFISPPTSEGLFESKTFPAVTKDGIYYLHVRFQNNKGWGPTLHYRIAVDSQPPVPFKIDIKTGTANDNPSPTFSFATSDSLSGIDHYEIFVNSEAAIIADSSNYTLLPQPPGTYAIKIKAIDKAGNSIEDKTEIEIFPIETPIINSISKKLVVNVDNLDVRGSAIPNSSVIVTIKDSSGRLVLEDESKANAEGLWEFRLNETLGVGKYFVVAKTRDSRGALSLSTEQAEFSFVEKPVISLFGLDITLRGLIITLIVIGLLIAGWFYRKALLHSAKTQRESVIISRDLANAFSVIKKDLDRITVVMKKNIPADEKVIEYEAASKKIKGNLDKIDKYIGKDIEKIK
jgi:hypothetical protein